MNTDLRTIPFLLVCWVTSHAQQIYPVAISIAPYGVTMNEGGSMQMTARLVYNTGGSAIIEWSRVQWRVAVGHPATVNSTGMLTAGKVYQDTQILFTASYQGYSNNIPVFIKNNLPDNFGTYAGDGMDDAWQVENFGSNHLQAGPLADPDGDGQNNRFEYTAGTLPLDRNSRFVCSLVPVTLQLRPFRIEIHPILPGRTYELQSSSDLSSDSWQTVIDKPLDIGSNRYVTDTSPVATARFYRVIISRP